MEIRLLQNLDHPNIVKYLDSIRSDDYLNIILEFVENGSLSSLLGKFQGFFPEQLCSHYITQVLKGLQYLHTQGVIHRDIKGANILSTKTGEVTLAAQTRVAAMRLRSVQLTVFGRQRAPELGSILITRWLCFVLFLSFFLQVKLADFGVATKLNESRKSDSVVGTPYW